MIWTAIAIAGLSFTHWGLRHRRDWGAFWLNIFFTCITLGMSLTVTLHAWTNLQVLRWLLAVFMPASKFLYNLI